MGEIECSRGRVMSRDVSEGICMRDSDFKMSKLISWWDSGIGLKIPKFISLVPALSFPST